MLRRNLILLLLAGALAVTLLSIGCDDLVTQTIKTDVKLYPTADFSVTTSDSGCAPLAVTFKDASSGPIKTWIWDFGDGSVLDTIQKLTSEDNGDVSHTYTTTGSFTVTLTVIDSLGGIDPETKKRAVIVGQSLDSLTISDTLICPNEIITFEAHDPFGVETWSWNFGDGSPISHDSALVQMHSYEEPGVYTFTLTINGGCGTLSLSDTVHIVPCPEVQFTMTPDSGCAPVWIRFTDMTPAIVDTAGTIISAPLAWSWNFGNGTTSTDKDDSARYAQGGSYPVTLTVTMDSGGVATLTDTVFIADETDADFTFTPPSDCFVPGRQYVVKFTDASAGATSWLWDFGDGYSSEEQNPLHAFLEPGLYSVTLTVDGPCEGASVTKNNAIEFADSLSPTGFRWEQYVLVDSIRCKFVDTTAASTVYHRLWNFGDNGTTSDLDSLDRAYSFKKDTTVQVILTRWNACDSIADTQQVTLDYTAPPTR